MVFAGTLKPCGAGVKGNCAQGGKGQKPTSPGGIYTL